MMVGKFSKIVDMQNKSYKTSDGFIWRLLTEKRQ